MNYELLEHIMQISFLLLAFLMLFSTLRDMYREHKRGKRK